MASQNEARRSKIDVEKASKFDHFLRPLGKRFFRPRSAQEAPHLHLERPPGGMRGSLGEDPPAHHGWSDGRVRRLSFKLNSFFLPPAAPGPTHPARPSALGAVGLERYVAKGRFFRTLRR